MPFSPLLAVAAAIRGVFDAADLKHRVFTAIHALCDEFEAMRRELPSDAQAALEGPWFKRAVRTLILQAAIETDEQRADNAGPCGCPRLLPIAAYRQENRFVLWNVIEDWWRRIRGRKR